MVVEEIISPTRVKHYSDQGMKIRQVETNKLYVSAADNIPCQYTYEETDVPIPVNTRPVKPEEALKILLGGEAK